MPKMKTSFNGLVQLLAKSLYPEPDVFIRELIQNAHDSLQLRQAKGHQFQGVIEIVTNEQERTITFLDNGQGMDKQDIENFLSTVGRSGTGEQTHELEEQQKLSVDTIGQFGIGLLSAFVIAEQIDVFTQKNGQDSAWHWVNQGGENYELDEIPPNDVGVGTRVVVKVLQDHLSHIAEEKVRSTINTLISCLSISCSIAMVPSMS